MPEILNDNFSVLFLGIFILIIVIAVIIYFRRKDSEIIRENNTLVIPLFGLGYSSMLSWNINFYISKITVGTSDLEYSTSDLIFSTSKKHRLSDIEYIDIGKFPGGSFVLRLRSKMGGVFKYNIVCWLANKKLLPEILHIFQKKNITLSEKSQRYLTENPQIQ